MFEYQIITNLPNDNIIQELVYLEEIIFQKKSHSFDELKYEFKNKGNFLTIVAKKNNKCIGFKIGFERRKDQFYSWIGGVHPEYQNQGVALELMKQQHQWLKDHSYERVRTQTGNEFRQMLLLNIREGFDVVGTFLNRKGKIRIILEKKLNL